MKKQLIVALFLIAACSLPQIAQAGWQARCTMGFDTASACHRFKALGHNATNATAKVRAKCRKKMLFTMNGFKCETAPVTCKIVR
jgi:hypothetical protein